MKGLPIFQVDVRCSVPMGECQALKVGPVRTVDLASSCEASGIKCNHSCIAFKTGEVRSQGLTVRYRKAAVLTRRELCADVSALHDKAQEASFAGWLHMYS